MPWHRLRCVQYVLVTEAIIYSAAKAWSGGSDLVGVWEAEPPLPIVEEI